MMQAEQIIETIRRMLIPRKCLLCAEPIEYEKDLPFCEDCESEWDDFIDSRCNHCGADRYGCSCLPYLVRKHFPLSSWAVFYNSKESTPVNLIVFSLKYGRYREVIRFCAGIMKDMLLEDCKRHGVNYKEFAVTYAPRRKIKKALYMFDQAREMAKCLAEMLELDFVEALENNSKREQKKLSSVERRKNAQASFKLKKDYVNSHKKYFLVDDIMTTGATLVYCSKLLFEAGATQVIPVTYAKDNYVNKGDY